MASDSAATYGSGGTSTIGQQEVTKLWKIGNAGLFGSTGAIGMAQMIHASIEKDWTNGKPLYIQQQPSEVMGRISKLVMKETQELFRTAQPLAALIGQKAAGGPVICTCLVAICADKRPRLFSFEPTGAPEEMTPDLPFVALGSGQPIADPFLAFLKRVFWRDHQPTMAEGRFAAAWTIRHVSQTNAGGVGGKLQLAVLRMDGATVKVDFPDIEEHYQAVEQAEDAMRSYIAKHGDEPSAPPLPEPPNKDLA